VPRVRRSLPLLAVLAVVLAGCGGTSRTASPGLGSRSSLTVARDDQRPDPRLAALSDAQVLAESRAAARAASSVRVRGSLTDDGARLAFDLRLAAGRGAVGTVRKDGDTVELVATGDTMYVRGTDAFYRSLGGPEVAAAIGRSWFALPAGTAALAGLESLTEMDRAFGGLFDRPADAWPRREWTHEGAPALAFPYDDQSGDGPLLIVSGRRPLYPLALTGGPDDPDDLRFTEWNRPVRVAAPTDVKTVDEIHRRFPDLALPRPA
jgi:hypothetical protein